MVGKTSILQRYIQGKFIKIEERTINSATFKKVISINNITFELNIWDTAGEEKYHALAPIFYRGADGAVITFDCTRIETFKKAGEWFKELNDFAENNPTIILVGNKTDLVNKCISNDDARELAKKYNGLFLEVSALSGLNINEIFSTLALEIYHNKMKNVKKKKKQNKIILEEKNDDDKIIIQQKKKGCCSS